MERITQNDYQGKHLEDDYPVVIKVEVARALNSDRQAYFLQQVKYWITTNKRKPKNQHYFNDGRWWMYNTLNEWQEQFPWLSVTTIQRIIKELKLRGILITGNYNKKRYDKTVWYSIDEHKLDELIDEHMTVWSKRPYGSGQNDHMDPVKMTEPIPETYPETYPERGAPSSLTAEIQNQAENIIQHYADLFFKANAVNPVITKANRKTVAGLLDTHGPDLLLAAVELHVKEPDSWTREKGCLLSLLEHNLPGYIEKIKQRDAEEEAEKKRREYQRQREKEERQQQEQIDKERAAWAALPEAEKQRQKEEIKKAIAEAKEAANQ